MKPKLNHNFSKNFLWGAATAAHQVEGGNHNQWVMWELENAKVRAVQAEYHLKHFDSWERIKREATNPANYSSGNLFSHYQNYKQDFDFLVKMNMNAYRFSVEWSRIEPECGVWNQEAIEHYKNYIMELKKRGIEPIMTLFHFSLPIWFAKKGGFEKRSNIKYFVRFAEKIIKEVGLSVKYVITINEIEIYAHQGYLTEDWPPAVHSPIKFFLVIENLIKAHKDVAKMIHRMSRHYRVSIAKYSSYFYAGDNAWLSELSAYFMQYMFDDYILSRVIKQCDFIGVNYYQSQRVYGYRIHNPEDRLSDLDWPMTPEDIQLALERLNNKYHKPILITENGLADSTDVNRKWWIEKTIIGMQKAIKNGVKLEGYIHWSLIDNFEWSYGKWPRFGLVAVDYKTGEKKLRSSAIWFASVIKKLRNS